MGKQRATSDFKFSKETGDYLHQHFFSHYKAPVRNTIPKDSADFRRHDRNAEYEFSEFNPAVLALNMLEQSVRLALLRRDAARETSSTDNVSGDIGNGRVAVHSVKLKAAALALKHLLCNEIPESVLLNIDFKRGGVCAPWNFCRRPISQ